MDGTNGWMEQNTLNRVAPMLPATAAPQLSARLPLDEVLREVVELASALIPSESCFIYLLEGDELILRASKNFHPEAVGRLKLKLGEGITGWVAEHRQPVIVPQNAVADYRFQRFYALPEDRFEAFLSVPLLSRGKIVGVINLQNREPRFYTEREISLISMIGYLMGGEIELARLEKEVSRLADQMEERKVVERAKGILQSELNIDEQGAYSVLHRESQQRRKPMKEIAEAILLSNSVKGDRNSKPQWRHR